LNGKACSPRIDCFCLENRRIHPLNCRNRWVFVFISFYCWANDDIAQTLLARNYRGDIPMSAVEKFPSLLSEAEEESSAVPPCFSHA
jgi:hypothetical protein